MRTRAGGALLQVLMWVATAACDGGGTGDVPGDDLQASPMAGGQTGESPADDDDDPVDEDPVAMGCGVEGSCLSAADFEDFSRLFVSGTGDYSAATSIGHAVSVFPIVVLGRLSAVVDGRKRFAGRGCDETAADEVTCIGDPNALIYDSYVNLVVAPDEVLKGTLEAPGAPIHGEWPWPNNVPIDALAESAPVGARVLLMGQPVREARAEARPLEEAGVVPPDSVPDNVLALGPYSLTFEDAEGAPHAILITDVSLAELVESTDSDASTDVSFDDVVAAVRDALAP